uniref:Putative trypsin-like serine protease n=1 Tax=Culex tarsalis TaxID=7177 RepID=A0A1Q3FNW4_CULTA
MQLRTTHHWRHPALLRCATMWLLLLLIVQSHGGAWRQVREDESASTSGGDVSCSDLFTLDAERYYQKRYEGTLLVTSHGTVKDNIELELRFDREVDLLVNYFGTSNSTNNRDFLITKQGYTLYAHSTLKLKLEVSYSTVLQPWLEEVRLNGDLLCPLRRVARTTTSYTQTPTYRYPPNTWNLGMVARPVGFVPLYQPRQPTYAVQPIAPRNFTDAQENKFNSSCQAMSPNIVVSAGRWDGVLTLTTDVTVDRVRIELVFDGSVYILGNYFGEVHTEDGTRFVIENSTLILAPDSEIKINFFVKFNENRRIPDVEEVIFNGKDVCRQRRRRVSVETETPAGVFGSESVIVTETSRLLSTTTNQPESTEEYDDNECATAYPSTEPVVQSRIIGGVNAKSGEIPWHVAIYVEDQYQCGGSIISSRSILTAAHCLTKENTNETLEADLLRVYIGIVNLANKNDHFYHRASSAVLHPDYNSAQHTTDIGILKLTRDIIFNNFIKPVCLYGNTTDISAFYNRYGKVAGWGMNRNGVVSNVLNYLDMPVVSQKKCSQTNVQYNTVLAYGESFCAGHADGNSVCNGDSGGGLVFTDNYRFYLRGIVSISAQKRNQLMCDPNRYSVFTDVSKFLKWIRQNMV